MLELYDTPCVRFSLTACALYIYTLFILRPVQMARVSLRSYSRTLILRVFGQFRLNTGLTPGRTIGVRTRGDVILPVHVDGTLIRSNNRLDPPRCRKDSHRWDSSFFFLARDCQLLLDGYSIGNERGVRKKLYSGTLSEILSRSRFVLESDFVFAACKCRAHRNRFNGKMFCFEFCFFEKSVYPSRTIDFLLF